MNWDEYFLSIAQVAALKSKDPSTKVGAVVVSPDNKQLSTGYNGFPHGIADTSERLNDRATKYSLVVHAEMNAILSAQSSLRGWTIYTTLMPCDKCFLHIIQAGIRRVVYPAPAVEHIERWGEAFNRVKALALEAKIQLVEYP